METTNALDYASAIAEELQESIKPSLDNIFIRMSLDEYIHGFSNRGIDFITIDKQRRDEIVSQQGWKEVVYIETIVNSECFRLWSMETWKDHETNNVEIKKEKVAEEYKKASRNHAALQAWKSKARFALVTKAKQTSEKAEQLISAMLNPEDSVKKSLYYRADNSFDDDGYKQAIGRYYRMREKLGYPTFE